MNNNNYIFAIDNGTQSVRALIFDLEGNLLGKGKEDIEPYFSTQPGFAEQHPEYFWESLGRACEKLWNSTDIKPRSEEHTSELQSRPHLVCRLLLEKKKKHIPSSA